MRFTPVRCRAKAQQPIVFLAMLTLIGCGSDTGGRAHVSGTVNVSVAPLDSGTIEIVALDASSQSGATITDGAFAIPAAKGLQPGDYVVRIYAGDKVVVPIDAASGDSAAVPVPQEGISPEFNLERKLTAKVEVPST